MSTPKTAKLRVCASCEWVFKIDLSSKAGGCPKCGFAHYGARSVYGDKCYTYAKTQRPWLDKKIFEYCRMLLKQITPARLSKRRAFLESLK